MAVIVDLILITIIVLTTVVGYKKGFIKSSVPLVSFVFAIVISCQFSSMLSSFLNQKFVLPFVTESVKLSLEDSTDENSALLDVPEFITENINTLQSFFDRWGTDRDTILEDFEEKNTEQEKLNTVDLIAKSVAEPVARVISNVISFVLLLIVSYIAARLLLGLLNLLFKMPLLNFVNKACGMLLGIINSLFIIWLVTLIISTFLPELQKLFPELDSSLFDNAILYSWFKENNIWTIIKHYLI